MLILIAINAASIWCLRDAALCGALGGGGGDIKCGDCDCCSKFDIFKILGPWLCAPCLTYDELVDAWGQSAVPTGGECPEPTQRQPEPEPELEPQQLEQVESRREAEPKQEKEPELEAGTEPEPKSGPEADIEAPETPEEGVPPAQP